MEGGPEVALRHCATQVLSLSPQDWADAIDYAWEMACDVAPLEEKYGTWSDWIFRLRTWWEYGGQEVTEDTVFCNILRGVLHDVTAPSLEKGIFDVQPPERWGHALTWTLVNHAWGVNAVWDNADHHYGGTWEDRPVVWGWAQRLYDAPSRLIGRAPTRQTIARHTASLDEETVVRLCCREVHQSPETVRAWLRHDLALIEENEPDRFRWRGAYQKIMQLSLPNFEVPHYGA